MSTLDAYLVTGKPASLFAKKSTDQEKKTVADKADVAPKAKDVASSEAPLSPHTGPFHPCMR